MPSGLPSVPATPSVTTSKLPVMASTARKRSTTHAASSLSSSGTFTAAPSAKRSPVPAAAATAAPKHRLSLSHLAPTPNSPLATPPRRSTRILDCYGTVPASTGKARPRSHASDRIRVCLRKRPLLQGDGADCVHADAVAAQVQVLQDRAGLDGISRINDHHCFFFDHVFDEHQSNRQIYSACVEPLLECFLAGGMATCFAYGQTGSGKTFTMLHPQDGLFFMAARSVFASLGRTKKEVWVSAYEIYRGSLFDILNERRKVVACEQADGSIKILGLKEQRGCRFEDLCSIVNQGLSNRSTGSTGANEKSSRSHAILQLTLRPSEGQDAPGRFSFIDLAGSERGADRADVGGKDTRLEGAEINKSLLALKECIRAIDQDSLHLPFRQSKLTQVLKDSFVGGGRCKTCMIATVSPAASNYEHTLNTLRYADRVKELQQGGVPSPNLSTLPPQEHDTCVANVTPKAKTRLSSLNIVDTTMESMAVLHDISELISSCTDTDMTEMMHEELVALRDMFYRLLAGNK